MRIASERGVGRPMVTKWRSRFAVGRLDALVDEPRPGRPRTISYAKGRGGDRAHAGDDAQGRHALVEVVDGRAGRVDADRGLADLAAFGCSPTAPRPWKLSKDRLFIDKVRDVVGLYLAPPERAVVLCVDEKSQIQVLRPRRADPAAGVPERPPRLPWLGHLQPLSAALDITRGQVSQLHQRHRAIEFKEFLATIDREVPDRIDMHLVLDNSSTHRTPAIQRWLDRAAAWRPRAGSLRGSRELPSPSRAADPRTAFP